MYIIKFVVEET